MPNCAKSEPSRRRWASALGMLLASTLVAGSATADPLAPTGRWSANEQGQAAVPPMGILNDESQALAWLDELAQAHW